MSLDPEHLVLPECFSGVVRLFPLPNLVLFPGVLQPLHIFESRYRQMVEDSLASDGLIATALMKPGWENRYESNPAIHPVICVGKIVTHTRLADGRFNLLLCGIQRARVVREIAAGRLYRMADVELIPRVGLSANLRRMAAELKLRQQFLELCRRDTSLDRDSVAGLLEQRLPVENIVDLIAFTLDADPAFKQVVLETVDLDQRLEIVSEQLCRELDARSHSQADFSSFPPCFSAN